MNEWLCITFFFISFFLIKLSLFTYFSHFCHSDSLYHSAEGNKPLPGDLAAIVMTLHSNSDMNNALVIFIFSCKVKMGLSDLRKFML